ncbi:MAG: MFS transporter [Candidatus Dormiibacterota bacterium]
MAAAQAGVREATPSELRRAIIASAAGNATEWYDYGVYSYVVPIIATVIFNAKDPAVGLVATYGALAASFLIRPLGGIVLGPLGDKLGRQRVLVLTILIMSLATFCLGLLPTHAVIGVWSPVLLIAIRLVQGFSTGGEYGGAATFMVEYSPDRNRGFWCSWLEFGTLGGFTVGAGIVTVFTLILPHAEMISWGWRVPFLLALPLGLVGLYLRLRLDEPPTFRELESKGQLADASFPVGEAVRHAWKPILLCIGVVILLNVADYTVLTYLPTYFSQVLGIGATESLLIVLATQIAMMCVISSMGALSDRIGRRAMLFIIAFGFIIFSIPAFLLIGHGGILGIIIGMIPVGLFMVMFLGTEPSTLPALFPGPYRYGGFAIAYNISTSLFGGTAPLVETALIDKFHDNLIPAYYVIAAAIVTLVPIFLMRETARRSIRGTEVPGSPEQDEQLAADAAAAPGD